jgi:ferredoxin--NADP+ reductase
MFEILTKKELVKDIKEMELTAPYIAKMAKAGQFVIVLMKEESERIPLTIADFNRNAGTITIVFQEVGKSTMEMGSMKVGDRFLNVIGPLGTASHIEGGKNVIFVGGGVGIPPVYPIARAFRQAGSKVISIIGARSKDLLIFEDRMRTVSDELIITTDDGSYGRKGLVTQPLKEILEKRKDIDLVVAIGPAIMMKFVALTTKPFGVKTIVSLNSVMVDGTGMCGACRVEVGGKTKFACVDGPDFDGHQVDFDLLMARQAMYREQERIAVDYYKSSCACKEAVKNV